LAIPNVTPPSEYFNAQNRAYPDISAIGDRLLIFNVNYVVVGSGTTTFKVKYHVFPKMEMLGTSASTPIISGIISLFNDIRAQQSKKSLGFLNPLLYQMYAEKPDAFNGMTIK